MGRPHYAASTTWIAVPLAAAQELSVAVARPPNRPQYLQSAVDPWTRVLGMIWAALAALTIALALLAARRLACGLGIDARSRIAPALLAVALVLLCAPVLPQGIRALSAAVPAGLLLLWAFADLTREGQARFPIGAAVAIGALLAWFPFCWPAAVVLLLASALGGSWRKAAAVTAVALFLGLVLEPSHLMHAGELPARLRADWLREGGWSGPGGPGRAAFLALAGLLGPLAWVFWVPASYAPRRRQALVATGSVWALWLALVALPALSGVRRPGAVQGSVAPLLAVWAALPLATLPRTRAGLALALAGALLIPGAALRSRAVAQERTEAAAQIREQAAREAESIIGPDSLWLAERAIFAAPPAGQESGFTGHGFTLPRDSRNPGRYDFAYWPRWYAGFRFVLLSSAQVRENLTRPDAQVPRVFYATVQSEGKLVREWGEGTGEGFRLYRLDDGAAWNRALSHDELAQLHGGPQQTWFLSVLGPLYARKGDLRTAALLSQQGVEWDPSAISLYNNLGGVYAREGEYLEASKAFEEGIRLAPRSFELLFNYGQLCVQQGLYSRAENLLRMALTARPDYPPVHYELGRAFMGEGKLPLAVQALKRYLALHPQAPNRAEVEAALARLESSARGSPAGANAVETGPAANPAAGTPVLQPSGAEAAPSAADTSEAPGRRP